MASTAAVVVAMAAVGLLVLGFNRLVIGRNLVRTAWSDVDVQLRRRSDLVPQLVEVVKGYAGHESRLLEELAAARGEAAVPDLSPGQAAAAEERMAAAAGRLMALAEHYPNLLANKSFLALQKEMAAVEEDINNARRYYNAVVRDYNTLVASVPTRWLASALRFAPAGFFGAPPSARRAPVVEVVS